MENNNENGNLRKINTLFGISLIELNVNYDEDAAAIFDAIITSKIIDIPSLFEKLINEALEDCPEFKEMTVGELIDELSEEY